MLGTLEMLILVAVGSLVLGAAVVVIMLVNKNSNSSGSQTDVPPIAKPKKE